MEIVRFTLASLPKKRESLSLALGNFDGLHRGHQSLFVHTSMESTGDAGALFFARPFGKGPYLTSVEDKIRLALNSHLDVIYVLDNDDSFFSLSPEVFICDVLKPLGTARVVVGEDFRFGKDGAGDIETLKDHFQVDVVPMVTHEGKKIASRDIKALLEEGKVDLAAEMLGKPYEVSGIISEGFHNGEKLGFPTANISSSFDYVLPGPGVYCGVCYVSGVAYRAMVNVGVNPTIGKLVRPIIEAHLLDFDKRCYGKTIYCSFLRKIRDEVKFATLDELKEQLKKDEASVRMMLG